MQTQCVLMFSLKQSFAYYLGVISEFNLQPWPLTFRIVGPNCRELAEFFCRAVALQKLYNPPSPPPKDGEVPALFRSTFFLQLHWLPTLKAGMESSGIRSGEIFTSVEPFLTAAMSYHTNIANKECPEKLLLQNKLYSVYSVYTP